jgi:hypothetical protein
VNPAQARPIRAVAVFVGETQLRWLRWLKPGFRHCFVALNEGDAWIALDPLAGRTEVRLAPLGPEDDAGLWYEAQGHRVVRLELPRSPARASGLGWLCVPCTCVGQAQRLLGAPGLALTPWRLYRRLLVAAAPQRQC